MVISSVMAPSISKDHKCRPQGYHFVLPQVMALGGISPGHRPGRGIEDLGCQAR